jgi:hypothetical protein
MISYVNIIRKYVIFQVITAESMKMRAFWDIASCSLVAVDRRFWSAYCFHHQGDDLTLQVHNDDWCKYCIHFKSFNVCHSEITLVMKAVRTSETSLNTESTGRFTCVWSL